MPDLYSNAMREAAQRDMLQLVQQNARLRERVQQLEQVAKTQHMLIETIPHTLIASDVREAQWLWQYAQAKRQYYALVEQETNV